MVLAIFSTGTGIPSFRGLAVGAEIYRKNRMVFDEINGLDVVPISVSTPIPLITSKTTNGFSSV